MWVVGTIVVLVVGAAVTVALGWAPRARRSSPIWNIQKMSGANSGQSGTLAGFSLTSAIFIAGVGGARSAPAFVTVFGMMLVGFLILVVATWISGSIPDAPHAEDSATPSLVLVLGSMCTTLGVSVTWLALRPLLIVVGLPSLAGVFTWWLLLIVLASGGWVAFVVYHLTTANAQACLAIPVVSLALPALYRLAAVRRWPALWPESDAGLRVAFVALSVAALMFALHIILLMAYGDPNDRLRLRLGGHRLALGFSQVYAIVVGLLWFAVVLP